MCRNTKCCLAQVYIPVDSETSTGSVLNVLTLKYMVCLLRRMDNGIHSTINNIHILVHTFCNESVL